MVIRVLAALSASICLALAGCGADTSMDANRPSTGPAVPGATTRATTTPATLGAFCVAYQALEEAEASADNDEPGAKDVLRAAADKSLGIGAPERMPNAARRGLVDELEAAYASLGVPFDRSTIDVGDGGNGDPAVQLAGYVDRHCPQRP